MRTDPMSDHSKETEYEDLVVTDGDGEKIFELKGVGILSVEGSDGSLAVEVEQRKDRSVFKTE